VPDSLEVILGTNPIIADIPKISIGFVQDISIGAIFKTQLDSLNKNAFSILKQEFSDVETNKGGDLDSLKVLRKKVLINQYNHLRNIKAEKADIITNDDLRTNILSSWPDETYYAFLDSLPTIDKNSDNDSGKFTTNLKIKLSNIKNVNSMTNENLMQPYKIICNKIVDVIINTENYQLLKMRDLLYDMFIYNLNVDECIWYIIFTLVTTGAVSQKNMSKVMIKTYTFFRYYNNNYRPIYHLENYILFLSSIVNITT
jgi:hypothetical protein